MHIFLFTISRISQPHQMWGLGGRTIDSLIHSYFQCQAQDLEYSCYRCCSVARSVWFFATPWTAAHQASQSLNTSCSLLKLMFIESMMPSNHLTLCRPLLFLPSIFPSIRVFSKESVVASGGQSTGVSASACPSNEYSGLIPFRMAWLDLFAVQGTLKSLLQHHSLKASILVYGVRKCSSFILLQVVDQFSQHHLLKRLSFFHCIFLPPLSKIRCP